MAERGHWTFDKEGKLIDYKEERPKQTVRIQTDEIPGGMISHADGKIYTSKSKYRQSLKALGFIEIGNERIPDPKPRDYENDHQYQRELDREVREAIRDVRDGNAELSELDKEKCKIINNQAREAANGPTRGPD